jgi:hypothetical protein
MTQLHENRNSLSRWYFTLLIVLGSQILQSQTDNFSHEYQMILNSYNFHYGTNKSILEVKALDTSKVLHFSAEEYFIDELIKNIYPNDTCTHHISYNSDLYEYKGFFDSLSGEYNFFENEINLMRITFKPIDPSDIDTLFDEDSIIYIEYKGINKIYGYLWDYPSWCLENIIINNKDTLQNSLYKDIVLSAKSLSLTYLRPRLYHSRDKKQYYLYFFTSGRDVLVEEDIKEILGTQSQLVTEPFYLIKLVIPIGEGCGCRIIIDKNEIEMYQLQFSVHPPF